MIESDSNEASVYVRFQAGRLVCFTTWCLFLNMLNFAVTLMMTVFSKQIRVDPESAQWVFQSS